MAIIGPREDAGVKSPIVVTPELEAAVAACATPGEIAGVMRDFAIKQGVAQINADGEVVPTALTANPPQKFGGYVTVDGRKTYVEGSSPEEYQAKLREVMSPQATAQQTRDERGRFVEQRATEQPTDAERAAAQADLELRFKRGEISTDQYIAQSGAIDRYLESQGVSMDSLRETSNVAFQKSWADATSEFLSIPGNDWPGGEENMRIVAQLIEANGLTDRPSADTLAQVIQFAKENGMLAANPQAELAQKLAAAQSPEEINDLLGRSQRNNYERGFFGRWP